MKHSSTNFTYWFPTKIKINILCSLPTKNTFNFKGEFHPKENSDKPQNFQAFSIQKLIKAVVLSGLLFRVLANGLDQVVT